VERVLSHADKALYARQILLFEVGLEGQQRLLDAAVRVVDGADARAAAVASDYLARAGVGSVQRGGSNVPHHGEARTVDAASASEVARVAGDSALEDCAAWLLGAFAAVEAIKAATGAGKAAVLDPSFVLSREVG
jgi:hypothetical protein